MINSIAKRNNITLNIRYQTQDSYNAFRMVEAELGVNANNSLTNQKWYGTVKVLPLKPPQTTTIGLPFLKSSQRSPAANRFIGFVKENWNRQEISGTAAKALGLMPEANIIMGIPMNIRNKNHFYDRTKKTPSHRFRYPENP